MQLLQVTWWELIALAGLAQSLLLLVYMLLRSGRIRNVSVAIACFFCLALGFLSDFGSRFLAGLDIYPLIQDMLWASVPIFASLLALQIAQIDGLPSAGYWWMTVLIPFTGAVAWGLGSFQEDCDLVSLCQVGHRRQVLQIIGVLAGSAALLSLWLKRNLLDELLKEKHFKSDRYWLILALIITNCALIFLTLSRASELLRVTEFLLIRNVLGCCMVYLASTSLFRIYPQVLKLAPKIQSEFNDEEILFTKKLEDLIFLQKVYQEPGYSRGDLARELGVSEAIVTRLVNTHFGKSVPQLLNEKRIEDAKLLLRQTAAPITVICCQVGFNSVPSFNRVFKEMTGVSPTEYRETS